jgi:hypothetical protein
MNYIMTTIGALLITLVLHAIWQASEGGGGGGQEEKEKNQLFVRAINWLCLYNFPQHFFSTADSNYAVILNACKS